MDLLIEKHPTQDFFIADIFDNLPIKDDIASMEHPLFTLSTKKDIRTIRYEHNGNTVTISPSAEHGLPTIFDKDILLYCGSLLMAEVNEGRIPPRTLRISTHDLLVATNRATDGRSYSLFKKSLDRLTSVYIDTNIKTGGKMSEGFHIIESYKILENSRVKKRMVKLEITLSNWFYNSIINKEALTIHRDYFRLRQSLERRIYEIARKHCGSQDKFSMSMALLHKKSGSSSPLKLFRFRIKKIIDKNNLPDYLMFLEENDTVVFLKRNITKELPTPTFNSSIFLKSKTLEKARELVLEARTGWDIYVLQEEFIEFNRNNPNIKNADGLFIGFVKKKIAKCP